MNCCATCIWYYEGLCQNPNCLEKGLLEAVKPDDSCTLWEED